MLVTVEVPTLEHAGFVQNEVARFLRDKAYTSNVTVEPFGDHSVAAALADEVTRLRAIIDAMEKR